MQRTGSRYEDPSRATTIRRNLIPQQVFTPTLKPGPGYDEGANVLSGVDRELQERPLTQPV